MAQRDRSQGFAFIYTDLRKLLAEKDNFINDDHSPIPTGNATTVNFNKITPPTPAPVAPVTKNHPPHPAVEQVRENLDRLQSLHHKLHAMLEELNQLTNDKKKR